MTHLPFSSPVTCRPGKKGRETCIFWREWKQEEEPHSLNQMELDRNNWEFFLNEVVLNSMALSYILLTCFWDVINLEIWRKRISHIIELWKVFTFQTKSKRHHYHTFFSFFLILGFRCPNTKIGVCITGSVTKQSFHSSMI